jgi:hypothetical protein
MDRPDDRLASLVRRLGVLAAAGTALAAAGCGHTPAQTAVGPPSPVVHSAVATGRTTAPFASPLPSLPPGARIVVTRASDHAVVHAKLGDIIVVQLTGSPSGPWLAMGDSAPEQLVQLTMSMPLSGDLTETYQARGQAIAQLAAPRKVCEEAADVPCDPFDHPSFTVTISITK